MGIMNGKETRLDGPAIFIRMSASAASTANFWPFNSRAGSLQKHMTTGNQQKQDQYNWSRPGRTMAAWPLIFSLGCENIGLNVSAAWSTGSSSLPPDDGLGKTKTCAGLPTRL